MYFGVLQVIHQLINSSQQTINHTIKHASDKIRRHTGNASDRKRVVGLAQQLH